MAAYGVKKWQWIDTILRLLIKIHVPKDNKKSKMDNIQILNLLSSLLHIACMTIFHGHIHIIYISTPYITAAHKYTNVDSSQCLLCSNANQDIVYAYHKIFPKIPWTINIHEPAALINSIGY